MESMSTFGMCERPAVLEEQSSCGRSESAGDVPEHALWELTGSVQAIVPAQRVFVSTQPFTIGRDWDNALRLTDATISRRHAELILVENDLFVRDISSRNGTFLNGRRITNLEKLQAGDLLQFGSVVFTVRPPHAAEKADAAFNPHATLIESGIGEYALGNLQFDKLLDDPALIPYFQPIVKLGGSRLIGYELLARSRLVGLENPQAMFRVAAERGLETELSELARRVGLRRAEQLGLQGDLYLNTHPSELRGPRLIESLRELRCEFPYVPIVLEIHESAVASLESLAQLRAQSRDLGMRLAYDDFGVGVSRLSELPDVPPDVIKFDMSLIRGLSHSSEERQNMVRSLVRIVRDLNVVPLAEGVETREEAVACEKIGFEFGQGYFFGRPSPSPAD